MSAQTDPGERVTDNGYMGNPNPVCLGNRNISTGEYALRCNVDHGGLNDAPFMLDRPGSSQYRLFDRWGLSTTGGVHATGTWSSISGVGEQLFALTAWSVDHVSACTPLGMEGSEEWNWTTWEASVPVGDRFGPAVPYCLAERQVYSIAWTSVTGTPVVPEAFSSPWTGGAGGFACPANTVLTLEHMAAILIDTVPLTPSRAVEVLWMGYWRSGGLVGYQDTTGRYAGVFASETDPVWWPASGLRTDPWWSARAASASLNEGLADGDAYSAWHRGGLWPLDMILRREAAQDAWDSPDWDLPCDRTGSIGRGPRCDNDTTFTAGELAFALVTARDAVNSDLTNSDLEDMLAVSWAVAGGDPGFEAAGPTGGYVRGVFALLSLGGVWPSTIPYQAAAWAVSNAESMGVEWWTETLAGVYGSDAGTAAAAFAAPVRPHCGAPWQADPTIDPELPDGTGGPSSCSTFDIGCQIDRAFYGIVGRIGSMLTDVLTSLFVPSPSDLELAFGRLEEGFEAGFFGSVSDLVTVPFGALGSLADAGSNCGGFTVSIGPVEGVEMMDSCSGLLETMRQFTRVMLLVPLYVGGAMSCISVVARGFGVSAALPWRSDGGEDD